MSGISTSKLRFLGYSFSILLIVLVGYVFALRSVDAVTGRFSCIENGLPSPQGCPSTVNNGASTCTTTDCPSNGKYQAMVAYSDDPLFNVYVDQVEYFSDPACTDKTANPCPASCSPTGPSNSQCGGGICADGRLAASQICSGNYGASNGWCVGAVCGYDCEVSGTTYSCPAAGRGTIVPIAEYDRNTDDNLSSTECNAWCNTVATALNADSTTLQTGQSTTLRWSTTRANSCTASNTFGGTSWTGAKNASGGSESTGIYTSPGEYGYVLQCSNRATGGIAQDNETVNVSTPIAPTPITPAPPPPGAVPTVSVSCSTDVTTVGGNTTVTWITGNSPTSCTASGDWSGAKAVGGGNENITLSQEKTYTFSLSCSNDAGTSPPASCTTRATSSWACSVWSTTSSLGTANANGGGCNPGEYCVELGGSYNPQTGIVWPVQQNWSWGGSNLTPARTFRSFPYGSSTSIGMTAIDNSGNGRSMACGPTTIIAPASPGAPTVGPGNLRCRTCNRASPDRWYWTSNCARFGPQDQNCAATCGERSDPNTYPAQEDQYCWLPPGEPPPPASGVNLHGTFYEEDSRGRLTPLNLSPIAFYWMWGPPFCTQQVNNMCSAGGQGGFDTNAGPPPNTYNNPDVKATMLEWSGGYQLIGYRNWTYVHSRDFNHRCRTGTDQLCASWDREACGERISCCPDYCEYDTETNCRSRTTAPTTITRYGPFTSGLYDANTSPAYVQYCTPADSSWAKIDFIFRGRNTHSISGNVFVDNLCDGRNAGDTDYNGALISLSPGSLTAISGQTGGPGNYSFTDLAAGSSYTVILGVPSGHRSCPSSPSSVSIPALGSDQTANFAITPAAGPWYQTKDADLLTPGTFTSRIPQQCVADPQCSEQFSLAGDGGYVGIPIYGGSSPNFGYGSVSTRGWLVNTRYTGPTFNYAYFAARQPAGVTEITDGTITNSGYFSSTGTADSRGYKWFRRNGDLVIDTPLNMNTEESKVVLFVSGNLIIRNRVSIRRGVGFFAAFAGGDIIVHPDVAYQGQPAPAAAAQPGLEGIFFAERNIRTGTSAFSNDRQLYVRGVLAALGRIQLVRNLDALETGTGNNTTAAEFIEYAPDLVLNFPPELLRDGVVWEEVAP